MAAKSDCEQHFRHGLRCSRPENHSGLHEAFYHALGRYIQWDNAGNRVLSRTKEIPADSEDMFPEFDTLPVELPKQVSRKRVLGFLKRWERKIGGGIEFIKMLKRHAPKEMQAELDVQLRAQKEAARSERYHLKAFRFEIQSLRE